jgi:hypothetical protein
MKEPVRNRLTVADLHLADVATIAALPVEELDLLHSALIEEYQRIKICGARLAAACAQRYGEPTIGTVHIRDGDHEVTRSVPKRVEWDSNKLGRLASLGGYYIRVKYYVLETVYNSAVPEIKKMMDTARTVKPGAAKYTFTHKGD